jgi:hypothetical protein
MRPCTRTSSGRSSRPCTRSTRKWSCACSTWCVHRPPPPLFPLSPSSLAPTPPRPPARTVSSMADAAKERPTVPLSHQCTPDRVRVLQARGRRRNGRRLCRSVRAAAPSCVRAPCGDRGQRRRRARAVQRRDGVSPTVFGGHGPESPSLHSAREPVQARAPSHPSARERPPRLTERGSGTRRGVFVALFRHIQYLGRRGCWRTALEFCKLLAGYQPRVTLLDVWAPCAHAHTPLFERVGSSRPRIRSACF